VDQGQEKDSLPKQEEEGKSAQKAQSGSALNARKAVAQKKAQSNQNTASKKTRIGMGVGAKGARAGQVGLSNAKSQKSVRFEEQNADLAGVNGKAQAESAGQTEATTEDAQHELATTKQQRQFDQEEVEEYNGQIEKTMKEIEELKEDYNWNLSAKNIN